MFTDDKRNSVNTVTHSILLSTISLYSVLNVLKYYFISPIITATHKAYLKSILSQSVISHSVIMENSLHGINKCLLPKYG